VFNLLAEAAYSLKFSGSRNERILGFGHGFRDGDEAALGELKSLADALGDILWDGFFLGEAGKSEEEKKKDCGFHGSPPIVEEYSVNNWASAAHPGRESPAPTNAGRWNQEGKWK
jgi:hypothetical protein